MLSTITIFQWNGVLPFGQTLQMPCIVIQGHIGGRSYVQNEVLCRFVFPERPGALVKFLDAFSPQWNITLFHYRGQGETGANVLVGIQVAQTEMDEFRFRANNLGYDYVIETDNEAFRLLVQ
ncbi:hypothetical protein RHMOL_Rhmol04G0206600 [Rhododendron molle]|uniref:Uncharacterized protein n=1 Tax=Rhododendron molle TaxID=49168 RepID=A0ACC0P3R6_RHOML|nr:hypothetical protein RHMOL_Rhmol04G0206600 [Rhododendron molle]